MMYQLFELILMNLGMMINYVYGLLINTDDKLCVWTIDKHR
jgi:hypothetical protein